MDPKTTTDLRRIYKTTAIIGMAMMGTLPVYAVIVEFLKNQPGEPPAAPDVVSLLRTVFLAAAILMFFAIQLLRKIMLRSGDQAARPSPAIPVESLAQKLMTNAIITFGLCETAATFGLVLFILGRSAGDFYLFLIISLGCFAVFFPRYGSWEEWIGEREQAGRRS